MPRVSTATELARLIQQLQQQRREHVAAIEAIDQTFTQFGIRAGEAGGPRKAGRAKAAKVGRGRRGRRRGKFAQNGADSVLEFVKGHGNPTAAEVNEHWRGEGRGGKADNTLGRLVTEGKLKRLKPAKGERGGRYVAA